MVYTLTLSTRDFDQVENRFLSLRTRTGILRFLGKWRPLSHGLRAEKSSRTPGTICALCYHHEVGKRSNIAPRSMNCGHGMPNLAKIWNLATSEIGTCLFRNRY